MIDRDTQAKRTYEGFAAHDLGDGHLFHVGPHLRGRRRVTPARRCRVARPPQGGATLCRTASHSAVLGWCWTKVLSV